MARRVSAADRVFNTINALFMTVLMIITFYPLMHVLALSASSSDAINANLVNWLPRGFGLAGYEYILGRRELGRSYLNSVAYAGVGTLITLLVTSMVAYSLSIKTFILRRAITVFFAITMFFGGGLIPTFLLIRSLGMLNTFWVMVIPGCVAAFTVIIFRTFFQAMPAELRESAFMDGANDIRILFRIILPLSKPLLATFGLFSVVGHWNSYFNAMIYLRDPERHPLQVLLRHIIIEDDIRRFMGMDADLVLKGLMHPKNVQMASIVVTMVPILLVYPFVQRYFTKGVMIGAIKG